VIDTYIVNFIDYNSLIFCLNFNDRYKNEKSIQLRADKQAFFKK